MTDVLKIALDRRAELHEEIEKLDDFIRMAEALIRASQRREMQSRAEDMPQRPADIATPPLRNPVAQPEAVEADPSGPVQRPQVIRRGAAAVSG